MFLSAQPFLFFCAFLNFRNGVWCRVRVIISLLDKILASEHFLDDAETTSRFYNLSQKKIKLQFQLKMDIITMWQLMNWESKAQCQVFANIASTEVFKCVFKLMF